MSEPKGLAETGAELLARIPEHLRDISHPDLLDGDTFRDAAVHVDETGCLSCRNALRRMGEAP